MGTDSYHLISRHRDMSTESVQPGRLLHLSGVGIGFPRKI
jgi:hypothetical protein